METFDEFGDVKVLSDVKCHFKHAHIFGTLCYHIGFTIIGTSILFESSRCWPDIFLNLNLDLKSSSLLSLFLFFFAGKLSSLSKQVGRGAGFAEEMLQFGQPPVKEIQGIEPNTTKVQQEVLL